MKMQKLSKDKLKKTYNNLQSKRKRIKIKAVILALFVLGVNIFAWFIYISKANLSLDANIVSWDISFFNDNIQVEELIITSDDLYPGMKPFEKEIKVHNKSELSAIFGYEVQEFNLKETNTLTDTMSLAEINNYLQNYYPFKITLSYDKEVLAKDEFGTFKVNISWEYENTNNYYKLNNLYLYDKTYNYYTFNGTDYIKDDTVTNDNFNNKVTSGIYLQKDDADSFWGEQCYMYKEENSKPCINLKIKLIVTQKEG